MIASRNVTRNTSSTDPSASCQRMLCHQCIFVGDPALRSADGQGCDVGGVGVPGMIGVIFLLGPVASGIAVAIVYPVPCDDAARLTSKR